MLGGIAAMIRARSLAAPLGGAIVWLALTMLAQAEGLEVGFGEIDITPDIGRKKVVWLAGYGMGRKATGVHDPLMARCLVLQAGKQRIALVSVDLIGLQYPAVRQIREALPDFRYVMVSSTHNHEGPDVIGIWGRGPFSRGVDDDYITRIVSRVSEMVKKAGENLIPVTAAYGTATDETLLDDSRKPYVKDGVLRVLKFQQADKPGLAGIVVQWNCHPESMGSRNTLVTADFPYATVAKLKEQYQCPVLYLSGAVGGLMAPPDDVIKSEQGVVLQEGDFEYCRVYGEEVAKLATKALDGTEPLEMTPMVISSKPIVVPVTNVLYRAARLAGVLKREGRVWEGDFLKFGEIITDDNVAKPTAVESEVAYLRLGELHIACIPGEIYPELVYGKYQEPVDPGADYPDAPLEPTVDGLMPGKKWLMLGLANDEVGYIIPRRQWDSVPPYAYGREQPQYGEINSCSPEVAPILMEALKRCVAEAAGK